MSDCLGHLQCGQRGSQLSRFRAELLGGFVPRNLTTAEGLGDGVAVDSQLAGRHPQFAGRPAQFAPGGVDRPAYHYSAGIRRPEDDRFIGCAEGAHPAVGNAPIGLRRDRVAQIATGPIQRFVLRQDCAGHSVGAGLRRVEDLPAGVSLGRPVVADRGLLTLWRPQGTAEAATGSPGEIDQRRGVQGNLETGEAVGETGRVGGEGVGDAVPGQLAAGERLAHQVTVVALVSDRHAQRTGGATEGVPGHVDRTANGPRAGFGCPEDRGLIAAIEGADPTVRSDQPGNHVDIWESQIAVGRTAKRLVFVQDRTVDQVRAGVGLEEDLAIGELLSVAATDLVDVAVLATDG